MGRRSSLWFRKGRGWFSTIRGQQIPLGTNRAEAKRELARRLAEKPQRAKRHTIHELIVTYLEWLGGKVAKKENSVTTLINYRQSLKSWDEFTSDLRLNLEDMRAFRVREWITANPQWGPTTAHTRVRHVKIFADWLESEDYIDANRLRRAKAPTPLKRQPTDPANFAKMEAVIDDEFFLAFFRVLYDTGARPGEISTLTADRINWVKSSAIVIGKTGERLIGLTPRALGILKDHAKPQLLTRFGNPWNNDSIVKTWRKWKLIAGCSDPCTSYHCRHDLDRRWRAAGISDIIISKQMGHTLRGEPTLKLMAEVYSHPDADVLYHAALQASQVPASSHQSRRRSR